MKSFLTFFKVKFRSLYLFTLALALLTSVMPKFGQAAFYGSLFLIFLSSIYLVYNSRFINKQYLFWVISFFSFFLISAIWALSIKLVFFVLFIRILPILLITFSISIYIKKIDDIKDVLKVFYYVAVFVLIYLTIFIDLSSIGQRLSYDQLGDDWNTNTIGIQFVFAIYCGAILFWKKSLQTKLNFVLVSLIMLYVILVTGSRKALIMAFIPVAYFIFFNKRVKLYVKLGLIVIAFGLIYAIFSIPLFYNIIGGRMIDLVSVVQGDTSAGVDNSRFFLILFGWDWFLDSMWLGYGINNYRVLSDATLMFAGKNFYAHCNYIELLVGVGVIGTAIYYSGYFYVMRKAFSQNSFASKWVMVLFLCLLFLDIAQVTYYGLIYMVFISIGFSTISLQKGKQTKNII